jgi:hypothetical protein
VGVLGVVAGGDVPALTPEAKRAAATHAGQRALLNETVKAHADELRSIKAGTGSTKSGWWTPENKEHAYERLRKGGLTDLGARAMVARWADVESTKRGPGDYNLVGSGIHHGHYGIGQWDPERGGGPEMLKQSFDEQIDSVKAALQKAALDDARTVNALLEKIAIDWLKERGYLK